jgi:very-short-patch-repair endonuclease/flagellar biosynthesis GTPase FlhF
MSTKGNISKKLNMARQELLDLGLRNPLINYRTLKARGLEIVDERPVDIFRILVTDKKKMTFLEISEKNESIQIGLHGEESMDIHSNSKTEKDPYSDSKLQTNYSEKQLQNRLLATYLASRTYIEEQGVNILYMAVGMLNWYESDLSQESRNAPLFLIPVSLDRTNARERFTVNYTEEDIGYNISLVAKMKNDFGIKIPSIEDDEMNINDYFIQVKEAIIGQKRWTVDTESIVIGFFSFGKFLMYWDLDVDNWPEHAKPSEHHIISALLEDGFNESPSSINENDHIDQYIKLEDSNLIKDADSSQIMAILDINQGRNMVIQGPPGTGKSQTITNLIAEAIGQGKKVLFVSEKMAALEVVKRRLDEVGLGVACLELHSHKTNKKNLLNELSNTLDLGKPVYTPNSNITILNDLRDRLNNYSHAVNTPVGNSSVTPYKALGEIKRYDVKYKELTFPKMNVEFFKDWTLDQFLQGGALLEELQSVIKAMGLPAKHTFWGSKKKMIMPNELDEIRKVLKNSISICSSFIEQCAFVSKHTEFPLPHNTEEADTFIKLVNRVLEAPNLKNVLLNSEKWTSMKGNLEQLNEFGIKYSKIHSEYEDLLIPAAWEQNLLEARQSIVSYKDKWWGIFIGDYRKAKKQVMSLYSSPKGKQIDYLQVIDSIMEAQHSKKNILDRESLAKELYNAYWNGMDSNWTEISTILSWVSQLHKDIANHTLPELSIGFVQSVIELKDLNKMSADFTNGFQQFIQSIRKLEELLEFDGAIRFENKKKLENQQFSTLLELLNVWSDHITDIQQLASYNQLSAVCFEEKLGSFAQLSENWEYSSEHLFDCYKWNWYQVIVTRAFQERMELAQFDGSRHEQAVKKFRELDLEMTQMNRFKLAEAHWKRLPQHEAAGQLGILRREFEKKSRHLPIRQLMTKTGHAIQAIKPVFMMSPLSIATFIPPGSIEFDLVIFDEASQVKPVDAFGAIIRGKQVVVVGDSKQMPPSNMFETISKDNENEEEDFVGDMESILGLFVGQNAPQRMLRWHYRSRHESLIMVSNHEFYDDKLVIFPSPDSDKNDSGLIYHYLPETNYDRGGTKTNKQEAKAVALAVMEHAKNNPNLSLGVAAFSIVQMQAIMDEIELLRRSNPINESFFTAHPHEPFFVKNLENVQGDERDVIFISIGYGKTAEGYFAMSFGLINNEGGERRLNVLISRAKIRCEVFTNLKSDDIDLNRSNAIGVKALKTFLKYADSGIMDVPILTGKDFDSSFEIAVYNSLIEAGYEIKQQVGSAGFFIDLAVVDPDQPGRIILGIECDGATYHSARSARDRDRLRQAVLEGLGWRIHRIWSTDWFRHPERELKKVIDTIENAKIHSKINDSLNKRKKTDLIENEIQRVNTEAPANPRDSIKKYECLELKIHLGGQEFHLLPISKVGSWVLDVVKIESPVHKSEVIKRICDAAAIKRIGTRIQTKYEESISNLVLTGNIIKKGDFLWVSDRLEAPIRNRSQLTTKKVELIAPEELETTIIKVVRDSMGVEINAIPQIVLNILGFSRVTDESKKYVDDVILILVSNKLLYVKGNQVFVLQNI